MAEPGDRGSPLRPPYARVTAAVMLTVALVAFDGLAVVAAVPQIAATLGDIELYAWVITAFLLTSTVAIPVAGPLVDALGVRATFRLSMTVFLFASAGCALAPSMPWLIAARAVQGVGGGFAFAVSTTTVGLAYPPAWRPRMFALVSTVWGVMSLAAPALAAVMVKALGWASVFWINLPLGLAAVWVGWNRLPRSAERRRAQPDWLGVALLGGFTTAALVATTELSALAAALAVALAVAYGAHARRAAAPVVSRRYLFTPPFSVVSFTAGAAFAALLGPIVYGPLFAQVGLGRGEAGAALTVAFFSVGWTSGSILTSRLVARVRQDRLFAAAAWGGVVALLVSAAAFGQGAPLALVYALCLFQGLTIGGVATLGFILMQDAAESAEMGRATTAHQYVRSVGQALGAGLAGALLFGVVEREVGSAEPVRLLLQGEDVALGPQVRASVVQGVRWAHLGGAALALAGALVASRLGRVWPPAARPRSSSPH